jgi:hypothetical protein
MDEMDGDNARRDCDAETTQPQVPRARCSLPLDPMARRHWTGAVGAQQLLTL